MAAAADRLNGLDALRGIAALCVVGLHARAIFPHYPDWLGKGYLAVDFFLMLSGYLMARITEPKLAQGLTVWRFATARYRRFWTTVAWGSVLGIPFLWIRTAGDPAWFGGALLANFALLPFPADHILFPLNVPVWTILAELLLNLLHVSVLHRLSRTALVAVALLAGAATGWVLSAYGSLDVGARPSNVAFAPPRIVFAYVLGILLWRWRDCLPSLRLPAVAVFALMPACILTAYFAGWRHGPFDLLFVAGVLPIVLQGALGLGADAPWMRFSAKWSFPLFASHVPALELVRMFGGGVVAGLALALGVSLVLMWWTNRPVPVEPPTNR